MSHWINGCLLMSAFNIHITALLLKQEHANVTVELSLFLFYPEIFGLIFLLRFSFCLSAGMEAILQNSHVRVLPDALVEVDY